jgi:glutathione S-transferase
MSLTLHYHPLSSFCHKVLIALYELDVPFQKQIVDLGNEVERSAFLKLWPLGKFPVIRDETRDLTVAESSIIIEYIDRSARLMPSDPESARECRMRDRFFDLYVHMPMQKVVTDKLRPEGKNDRHGVEHAKAQIETAYAIADEWLRAGPWALGDAFTMADCAAAPALFYANQVVPFGPERKHLADYFSRLEKRPSFARVLDEMKPYWSLFPGS